MVKCKNTGKRYQCIVKSKNYRLFSDTTKDKGGSEEGIRPHELLEAALASCLNMTIQMALDKLKIEAKNILVQVDLIRDVKEKTIFDCIYRLDAKLNDDQKKTLEESIVHCSVKDTLMKEIHFHIKAEE
ncbi:MAG: OsmC family protein [Candidatus Atribacteria bacterium]|nr:OsmC family protein [Candidatus Atribacteria bacterium]